jgi:hypothetical protein
MSDICRLILARSAVSIISLAAGVRRCHGTIEMHDYMHQMKRFIHYHEVDFRATPIRRRETCVRCSACLRSKQSHKPLSSVIWFGMQWHVTLGTNATS